MARVVARPVGWRWWLLGIGLLVADPAGNFAQAQEANPEPTPAAASAGVDKPEYLDRMIREAWASADLKPSPPASDAEFLRRLYLDLVGRIPTLAEAVSFLESRDPAKRTKLVNQLLDHPDYAKNFANLWMVSLVGRSDRDRRFDREGLSSWLRLQFSQNRPWNEIANDLVTASGSNKENGAANFVLAYMEADKVTLTSVTTRAFLGKQIQCTQCHDHPSPAVGWKQADFWGINAFFKGLDSEVVTKVDETGAEVDDFVQIIDNPTDEFSKFDRRDGTVRIVFPTYLDGRKISQGTDVNRREALGRFLTEPENRDFTRAMVNRMWGHFLGRGFVNPVEDMGEHNPPSHPELLDKLADDFRTSGYDLKALIRWITSSEAYQLTSQMTKDNEKDESLFSHMAMKPMTPEQLFESLLVATQAQKAGGEREVEARRRAWLNQFVFAFANDEEQEGTSFQGTIPQALMMMNGDLMTQATSAKPGSFLAGLLDAARLRRGDSETFVVTRLYLAALSRPPTNKEMGAARQFLASNPDTLGVIQDLFWALLNSNEFVLNH